MPQIDRRQIDRRTVSLFGLAALLRPQLALAHDVYPSRPIHIIVGFTPGAAADITGRVLGDSLGPIIGQQIVVENKPGAGSSIAAEYVAHAGEDGYMLFLATLSIIVNQIINPNPSLDLERTWRRSRFWPRCPSFWSSILTGACIALPISSPSPSQSPARCSTPPSSAVCRI